MPLGLRNPEYWPALLGSAVVYLGAAAVAMNAAGPGHAAAAGASVLIAGAGSAALNRFNNQWQQDDNEQRARRNHLIRRGMAEALREALLNAESALADDVPEDLRAMLFKQWPLLLARAKNEDAVVDLLFPLTSSEDQWALLNRYYEDLEQAKDLPDEFFQRFLRQREQADAEMLADLLRSFPAAKGDTKTALLLDTFDGRWPQADALRFARNLLPLYRGAFATVFSKDDTIAAAIEFKQQRQILESIGKLDRKMDRGFDSLETLLRASSEGLSTQIAGGFADLQRDLPQQMEEAAFRGARRAYQQALQDGTLRGLVTAANQQAIVERTAREIPRVIEEVRESTSPIATDAVERLLSEGKLEEAAKVVNASIAMEKKAYAERGHALEKAKSAYEEQGFVMAQSIFLAGRVEEVSFRWTDALENFRQAWELSGYKSYDFGFKYAYFASSLNQHAVAVNAYEDLLKLELEPADRAGILNNLGVLYRDTQRHALAEGAYTEALALYRQLAGSNPAAYEPDVAMTLNNLGILYPDTQRHALAEGAYTEALALRRQLAGSNPSAYEPYVAMTLNNLGILYASTQRHALAEGAYTEALALRRQLAGSNPAAYEPDVAGTLYNVAWLHNDKKQYGEAERPYMEALEIYRRLAGASLPAYGGDLADTLHNMGLLYSRKWWRWAKAMRYFAEEREVRAKWLQPPE